jgi:glutathione S-transferase
MNKGITIWTYDWVPAGDMGPRGHVRDLRLRWACEEAGLTYDVRAVPIKDRGPEHFARQPFGQIPFLEDDGLRIFESGACLLHLGKKSELLMPRDAKGEAETLEWTIAALNSIEMVTVPWWYIGLSNPDENPIEKWMRKRLGHLEVVLQKREWLAAGRFTIADILMADALRVPKLRQALDSEILESYIVRATERPAFKLAHQGQMDHFAAADAQRP